MILARRIKNKHVRHEYSNRRRIANNLESLSCSYNEMEPKAWLEPENEFGKFAVAFEKCDVVVDIYQN